MAQSRRRRHGRPGHRHARRRPRRLGQAAARLARLRDRARAGQDQTLDLGPHEYNTDKAQGAVVVLPKKQVTTELVAPAAGTKSWWSGAGDDLDTTMTPSGDAAGRRPASLTFQANWDIEDCGPDAVRLRLRRGQRRHRLEGHPRHRSPRPAEGNGIDGTSGGWTPATFDLSAYAGKTVDAPVPLRPTDGAGRAASGFFADDITRDRGGDDAVHRRCRDRRRRLDARRLQRRRAPRSPRRTTTTTSPRNRTYVVVRQVPADRPVQLRLRDTKPDYVEHFPYQDGLLISLLGHLAERQQHQPATPGGPDPADRREPGADRYSLTAQPWRARVQGYDAPFGLQKSDSFTLHLDDAKAGELRPWPGGAAAVRRHRVVLVRRAADGGVKVPNNGVKIKVLKQQGTSMGIRVWSRDWPATRCIDGRRRGQGPSSIVSVAGSVLPAARPAESGHGHVRPRSSGRTSAQSCAVGEQRRTTRGSAGASG